eukprot:jgi/Picsp_1/1941/NSC_05407-R1_qc-snare tlg1 syntaxin 6-family
MSSSSDPFYLVRDEVNESLAMTATKLRQYEKGSITDPKKLESLRAEVQDECQGLYYMLQEIERSIEAAERNPSRFKLNTKEVQDRKSWMLGVRRKVDDVLAAVQTSNRNRSAMEMSSISASDKLSSAVRGENDRFITSEMAQQEVIMARQDQDLDQLSQHVVRIGELGREMGQELDAQGQILDEFGYEMEGTQTRLAAAQRKVQYVLDRAGTKGQLIIIGVLVVVLVVLIVMTIS